MIYLKFKAAIIGQLELDPSCKIQKVIHENYKYCNSNCKTYVKYSKTESLNVNFPNQTFGSGI